MSWWSRNSLVPKLPSDCAAQIIAANPGEIIPCDNPQKVVIVPPLKTGSPILVHQTEGYNSDTALGMCAFKEAHRRKIRRNYR